MTISARFVSRYASFPTKCVMPQRPDLGSLTPNAELATATEKMQRRMRRYIYLCRFSFVVADGDASTCGLWKILIKMADALFLIFVADPITVRWY